MKTFKGLNKSEIKKAINFANKINGCDDCTIAGYSYNETPDDEFNCIEVRCTICHNYEKRAEKDVAVTVWMDDRRSSYAHIC